MRAIIVIVRANRILLLISTVGLGVVGAKVAENFSSAAWWLFAAAFAALLGLSDVCRQIDEPIKELSRSTRVDYLQAATDYLKTGKFASVLVWASIGLLLLAAGIVSGAFWDYDVPRALGGTR